MPATHLFVDISAHGFGHLAQVGPVLNALVARLPSLRITLRSGLPKATLQARLSAPFAHIADRSDFGYVMHDAVKINRLATASAYRQQHADWEDRVDREARLLTELQPDLLLSDVAYLPLAGAARAGIPSVAMCSLNWAELFAHFYGNESWAPAIHAQMLAAYRSAAFFLRLTPGMAMADLPRLRHIAPVATLGNNRRQALRTQLHCTQEERLVLIAFGGVARKLPIADWPALARIRWLVPKAWQCVQTNFVAIESLGIPVADLMASVDAVLTKPGYGTFTEAACNGTPVLFQRRQEWPEQDCLIDWLRANARCAEIEEADLLVGRVHKALESLWQQPAPPLPRPTGAEDAVAALLPWLLHDAP